MSFLFNRFSHFNLANLATFSNIICGLMAMYLVTHDEFIGAAAFAWLGGAFDIVDGKIARKYQLSTEFGIQLDSYADFLSFVLVPTMFIYFAIIDGNELAMNSYVVFGVFAYYIISGLRRLIQFNINSDAGTVAKHFVGVPTPLGAILLWIVWLGWIFNIITDEYIVLAFMTLIGFLLNSKVKIPHL